MAETFEQQIENLAEQLESQRDTESGGCFFTCYEHAGYPLGKAFGPYEDETDANAGLSRHHNDTGHDYDSMAVWCNTNIVSEGINLFSADPASLRSEPTPPDHNLTATRCFCTGLCFKGTGDSSHFTKTIDVDCSLTVPEMRKLLWKSLIGHYVDTHGVDISDPEAAMREISANTEVRCTRATH